MCHNQNIHYPTMHHDASVCMCVCTCVLERKKINVKRLFLRQMNETKQENESERSVKVKIYRELQQ